MTETSTDTAAPTAQAVAPVLDTPTAADAPRAKASEDDVVEAM